MYLLFLSKVYCKKNYVCSIRQNQKSKLDKTGVSLKKYIYTKLAENAKANAIAISTAFLKQRQKHKSLGREEYKNTM